MSFTNEQVLNLLKEKTVSEAKDILIAEYGDSADRSSSVRSSLQSLKKRHLSLKKLPSSEEKQNKIQMFLSEEFQYPRTYSPRESPSLSSMYASSLESALPSMVHGLSSAVQDLTQKSEHLVGENIILKGKPRNVPCFLQSILIVCKISAF